MKMNKKNIPLVQSFKCAIKGLISCLKTERNIRIHLCFFFYIVWFSHFYNFSDAEKAIIAMAVGIVIVSELLNTAVETVVDLVSPERNKLAGLAKDIAAGGVLASALTSAAVGIILFWDFEIIKKIVGYYAANPVMLVLLAITLIIWLGIIFLPVLLNNKNKDDTPKGK